jgi:hypothetical protein
MKVIKVDSEKVRYLIEEYSRKYCFPDLIQFVQDGAGNYIVGTSVLQGKRYVKSDKEKLEEQRIAVSAELSKTTQELDTITKLLLEYGEEIEYIKPKEEEEIKEDIKIETKR